MAIKLYDVELSGNCYRVRLFLSMLGLPHELRTMNLAQGEQREAWYLALNPRGQVPVLEDQDTIVWDSLAILVYLARQYGGTQWLPLEAKPMAEVIQWLGVMESETLFGLGRSRILCKFKRPGNLEEAQALGRKGLDALENRLSGHPWLALERITIADIGCFPYVALAAEGQVDLEPYGAVRLWMERIKAQPGFITMPGI